MYIGSKRLLPLTSKGDSAFIRYSANADGADFTEEWSEGQNYIGFATGQTAPTEKSGYTWVKFSDNLGEVGTAHDHIIAEQESIIAEQESIIAIQNALIGGEVV